MQVDRKNRMTKGILFLLAAVLLVGAAYCTHQANVLGTQAANLRDGTVLDPGLSMGVIGRLVAALVFGGVSIRFLVQGRPEDEQALS
jgi:hypothetical protein